MFTPQFELSSRPSARFMGMSWLHGDVKSQLASGERFPDGRKHGEIERVCGHLSRV